MNVYIDGKLVPSENVVSVSVGEEITIVELVYPDKKEKIITDSSIRNIEIKDESKE